MLLENRASQRIITDHPYRYQQQNRAVRLKFGWPDQAGLSGCKSTGCGRTRIFIIILQKGRRKLARRCPMTDNPTELSRGSSKGNLSQDVSPALALATAVRIKTILIAGIHFS
jgi:hypothetical protein